MIYRDSNYRRHSGKVTTDIVRIITSQSGYRSGRLFNTMTTVPVILLKTCVAEGAALVLALRLGFADPFLYLQFIILMQPDEPSANQNLTQVVESPS